MKYRVLSNLNHNGEVFLKDQEVVLADEIAKDLVADGVLKPTEEVPSEPADDDEPDDSAPTVPAAPEAPANDAPLVPTPPADPTPPAQITESPVETDQPVGGQPSATDIAATLAGTESPSTAASTNSSENVNE